MTIYAGLEYHVAIDATESAITAVAATHRVTGKVSSAVEAHASITYNADPDLETAAAQLRGWMLLNFATKRCALPKSASYQALAWLQKQGLSPFYADVDGEAETIARHLASKQKPKKAFADMNATELQTRL